MEDLEIDILWDENRSLPLVASTRNARGESVTRHNSFIGLRCRLRSDPYSQRNLVYRPQDAIDSGPRRRSTRASLGLEQGLMIDSSAKRLLGQYNLLGGDDVLHSSGIAVVLGHFQSWCPHS